MTDARPAPEAIDVPAASMPLPAPDAQTHPFHHAVPPGNRATDLALAALIRTRDAALAWAYGTWIYGQSLRGPMPDHMVLYPRELRPGHAEKADALFQGRWFLPGGQVRTEGASPFGVEPPSEPGPRNCTAFHGCATFTAAAAMPRAPMRKRCGRLDRAGRLLAQARLASACDRAAAYLLGRQWRAHH